MKPESLMMSYGFKPELSEGSVKCPIFMTSTFAFKNAEAGKAFFEIAYGRRSRAESEEPGLIYSRINNPDLEILENRLTLWDVAEDCAVFESGMAAITTVLLEFLNPGDLLLISSPLYGGSDHFIKKILIKFNIRVLEFSVGDSKEKIINLVKECGMADKLSLIYIETPANPTNDLIDIESTSEIAKHFSTPEKEVLLAVDNTYMGPVWQHPLKHGANLVLYSATKYIGGHSDIIAGACLGSRTLLKRVKAMRTFLGNMASPHTGWLLLRSLETLKPRMDVQSANANKVAAFLTTHPRVEKVYFPGNLIPGTEQYQIKQKQCLTNGGMISFDVKGGEAEAFKALNALKLIKLAVSLGSTESLAEHPATMTHSDVDENDRIKFSITEKMIRLSVGVENFEDIISDLQQALEKI
ncbi:MAG: cystathionine gamma-synthase family protein [Chitinophagaceae bacterium]|nr:cystathionine gamma-synthase family protein [Bacteroidota bacterium]MCC6257832.1 cystathionine gamma-synthase family protein [Chitinophagaceae bacterium]MCW5918115.1 cystathionine gamma-synthase family protein [Ferruginibacter sp.]